MEPKRVFVAGSLNIDLVMGVERLPREGETVVGSDLMLHPGGKGANQVCAAGRLGGRAAMIGQLGCDPFAAHLLTSLQNAGVDTAGVGTSRHSTGAACIFVLPSGENAIAISPGANASLTPEAAVARLAALQAGDLVLLQLEVPLETVEAVLTYALGRGAVTMLDPAPARPLSREMLRSVTYLTPNQSEAGLLLGNPDLAIESFDDAARAADRLLEMGPSVVVLKLGHMGCFLAARDFRGGIEAFPVTAVDTTAAGDTFNGAFAVGLAEGMPAPAAARFACAASAISVTRAGAQSSIPVRSEVMALLEGTYVSRR
jgi:ribokinase